MDYCIRWHKDTEVGSYSCKVCGAKIAWTYPRIEFIRRLIFKHEYVDSRGGYLNYYLHTLTTEDWGYVDSKLGYHIDAKQFLIRKTPD